LFLALLRESYADVFTKIQDELLEDDASLSSEFALLSTELWGVPGAVLRSFVSGKFEPDMASFSALVEHTRARRPPKSATVPLIIFHPELQDRRVLRMPEDQMEVAAQQLAARRAPDFQVCGRPMWVFESLPIVLPMPKIYQRFYTQFVSCRCKKCEKVPKIPFICMVCGSFLCCHHECCLTRCERTDKDIGEVTAHARKCGFGTSWFLQLSNSLMHYMVGGKIAIWGSCFVDSFGEEDYMLSKPLFLSHDRIKQMVSGLRLGTTEDDLRLQWKTVVRV